MPARPALLLSLPLELLVIVRALLIAVGLTLAASAAHAQSASDLVFRRCLVSHATCTEGFLSLPEDSARGLLRQPHAPLLVPGEWVFTLLTLPDPRAQWLLANALGIQQPVLLREAVETGRP